MLTHYFCLQDATGLHQVFSNLVLWNMNWLLFCLGFFLAYSCPYENCIFLIALKSVLVLILKYSAASSVVSQVLCSIEIVVLNKLKGCEWIVVCICYLKTSKNLVLFTFLLINFLKWYLFPNKNLSGIWTCLFDDVID